MAGNLTPYYLLQSAFTGGEISDEVANRVDLDKYQFAMLQARNCMVRPYGPVYRRPGMKYIARAKYSDKQAILVPFNGADGVDYLLEIGDKYIRVYKDGQYLNVEVTTPFAVADLPNLRFTQSADVMFIASGAYPVKQLARYSDTDWRFGDFEITDMYYDESLTTAVTAGESYMEAGTYTFVAPVTGVYSVNIAAGGGGGSDAFYLSGFHKYASDGGNGGRGGDASFSASLTAGESYTVVVGAGGAVGSAGGNSSAFEHTVQGGGAATVMTDGTSYGNGGLGGAKGKKDGDHTGKPGEAGWCIITLDDNNTIKPSAKTGTVTLTAKKNTFTAASVGAHIMLKHDVEAQEVTVQGTNSGESVSASVLAGDGWKVISHGTWTGTFEIQKSDDGTNWRSYRKYNGKDDYNPAESGNVTEPTYLRAVCNMTSGTCNVSLTAMPWTKEGKAKITEYTDAKNVTAVVAEAFGDTTETEEYYFGAWCEEFGYPKTIGFFQDRMIFGGTMKQPYMLWMSRTGDYGNFSVEKVSGTVTDDSAVAIGLVSRKQYQILHLVPSTDLLILTAGNEWTISGGSTVTPANVSVRMQTTCGCSSCEPIMADGRIVFVQGRGSTVRDMGYSYDTDSYGGNDLTLLAKHIIQGIKIVDSAYKQEPDSTLYFVRSDGTMACLAYILDQKVYAWSTVDTDGNIEAVAAVQEGDEDIVYVLVKRNIAGQEVRNIECLHNNNAKSNVPNDYIMLDCAVAVSNEIAVDSGDEIENDDNTASRIFSVPELAGATVDVLGDGRAFEGITVGENGELELPASVTSIVAGLPYKMVIELPNVEIKVGDGTMQGRFKQVSECTLRLSNSCGGQVGCTEDSMDRLPYDELSAVTDVRLFSGDKVITLPVGGFNNEGRAVIVSDEPYPFNLLAIVRKVTFGG